MFRDRKEAGQKLAVALQEYANAQDVIVLALPRGGVVVGFEVASRLHLPLDIICPRKIGAPFNPEYAIGAVTETGEGIFSQELIQELGISEKELAAAIEKEKEEALRRLNHYREGKRPREIRNKRVILIDDGLATGSTMRAAIRTAREEGAKEVIVAVPVAPKEIVKKITKEVDRIISLSSPSNFFSVGQFYEKFDQVEDEEVIALLSNFFSLEQRADSSKKTKN